MFKSIALAGATIGALSAAPAMAESRDYDLAPFQRINVSAGLNAVLVQGDTQSVQVEASSKDVLDKLSVEVIDGELRAGSDAQSSLLDFVIKGGLVGMIFGDHQSAKLIITVPSLSAIEVTAGADLTAEAFDADNLSIASHAGANISIADITAKNLVLTASSGADLDIFGTCQTLNADFSTGSDVDASGLACADAEINGSTGANARIAATGRVTGSVSTGADLKLFGEPSAIDVATHAGGSVNQL